LLKVIEELESEPRPMYNFDRVFERYSQRYIRQGGISNTNRYHRDMALKALEKLLALGLVKLANPTTEQSIPLAYRELQLNIVTDDFEDIVKAHELY